MELAIGFRFYPTEEELISFYLHNKLQDKREDDLIQAIDRVVAVLDIYDFDPWQLPRKYIQLASTKIQTRELTTSESFMQPRAHTKLDDLSLLVN